jgi:RNA polymerase sigma factor (sigma-70 family)
MNNLDLYYNDLASVTILSREEELACYYRALNGDQASKDKLIKSNLRLVFSIAKGYGRGKSSEELLDMISAGNEGLLHAFTRYDPNKGTKFSTYCGSWVLMYIRKHCVEERHLIKPSSKARRKARLSTPNTFASTVVFEETYMSSTEPDLAEDFLEINLQNYNLSTLNSLLTWLTERERLILELSFGLRGKKPLSLRGIGSRLGLSSERIRQIRLRTLQTLAGWLSFFD